MMLAPIASVTHAKPSATYGATPGARKVYAALQQALTQGLALRYAYSATSRTTMRATREGHIVCLTTT